MSVANYLELLDWTARELRADKRGATPASAAPIFKRLGIDAEVWCELTRDFGKLFATVAGKPKVIESTRSRHRIQAMLGHADIRTTQIYTQVSIRKLQQIH